jgi:hypothetical protein
MKSARPSFADRLRQAMEAAGHEPKASVLEKGFNTHHWGKPMTLHGVRRWLAGETVPPYSKVESLAKWLGVSVDQLYGGSHQAQERRARWDADIGWQERDIIEAFLKLPVPQRRVVREVILTFAKVHADTTKSG